MTTTARSETSFTSTVAKIANSPHMPEDMRKAGLFSCTEAGSPKGLAVATVARPLHPYRTEISYPTSRVADASRSASKAMESITE